MNVYERGKTRFLRVKFKSQSADIKVLRIKANSISSESKKGPK